MSKPVSIDAMTRMNAAGIGLFASSAMATVTAQLTQLGVTNAAEQKAAAPERIAEIASAYGYSPTAPQKPYAFQDGVAIIPVHGMLLNRFSYGFGFVTGYQYIRGLANLAADDEDVELICYDINSYGGEAAGCFELCADLAEISTRKPTMAMVDSAACSAAYAVASVQRKIVASPSSTVGSIGVIAMHIDISGAMTQAGVKMTLIAEGTQKTAGNPYEPLSPEALADITERVGERMDMFVAQVAAARGDKGLDEAAIRATESRCYLAQQALDLKLIDAVQTPSQAVSSFLAELGDDIPSDPEEPEDEEMAAKTEAEQAAELAAATAQAKADGVKEGATAERQRVTAIMGLPEAKTRPALAAKLAAKDGMSVEDAKELLEAAAEEKKEEPASTTDTGKDGKDGKGGKGGEGDDAGAGAFGSAMDRSGGAGVPAGDGKGGSGDSQGNPSRAQRALQSSFGKPLTQRANRRG